ncbi:MAG: hypothetical protein ACYTFY_11055 [Planctomycetota bacterium]|jgi:hypothetical protein
MYEKNFKDCSVNFADNLLTIANKGIERVWDLSNGAPAVVSVKDLKSGNEWCGESPYQDSLHRNLLALGGAPQVDISADVDDYYGVSEKHLLVHLKLVYSNAEVNWEHRIWPELPVVLSQYHPIKTQAGASGKTEEFYDNGNLHLFMHDDRLEFFGLSSIHLSYDAVSFTAQSDRNDNLVRKTHGFSYPKEHINLQGQSLHLKDRISGNGLLAMKIAPPHSEHLNYPGFDFSLSGNTLAIVGSGISADELSSGEEFISYSYAVGVTDGEEDAAAELMYQLDRKRMKPNPPKNFKILSNTWGDGNGSKKICEQMMLDEISAASEIGLTHCQLDAGWQKGKFSDLRLLTMPVKMV